MQTKIIPTTLDTYRDILKPGLCDFCPDRKIRRVYTDPETHCRFCLLCLELATEAEDRLPEDPAMTAYSREYISTSRKAASSV